MSAGCEIFRDLIPRAMMADLDPAEQQNLEKHLAECGPCARERELYAQTFLRLRSVEDVPVPRHFLVHPEERGSNPWRLFRAMPLAWQASVAAVAFLLLGFSALAAARLQVRAEDGTLVLAFGGKLPAMRSVPAPVPALDTSALEAKILRVVEERNRKEELEWVRRLRAEVARSQRGFTGGQRALLATALENLENRMNSRVDETARVLDQRRAQSVTDLYKAVKLQQDSNLALVDAKLNRLAINGEKKNNEIDAILETILQVAELNTQQSPGERQ